MQTKRRLKWITTAAFAVLGAVSAAAGQTAITLRAAANAPAGAAIRIIDLAQVTGEDAERLGAVVVMPAADAAASARFGQLEVDVASVRRALDGAGVNWGRTTLSGGAVPVRLTGLPAADAPHAAPRGAARPAETVHQSVDLSGPPTVRTHIAARLAHMFGVEARDLRLRFRAEDDELLRMSTAGRRVDVQPAASASSSRLPLRVFVYTGDRITATGAVTVEALVRRDVATATSPIERGQVIAPELFATSSQWLEPNARVPATVESLLASGGAVARARVNAGEVITQEMVQPPLAAKRGDLVTVHCLSGSVTVRVRARALGDVRDGEVGTFRMEGSKKTFYARMDGSGRAVMVVDGREGPMAMAGGQEALR